MGRVVGRKKHQQVEEKEPSDFFPILYIIDVNYCKVMTSFQTAFLWSVIIRLST